MVARGLLTTVDFPLRDEVSVRMRIPRDLTEEEFELVIALIRRAARLGEANGTKKEDGSKGIPTSISSGRKSAEAKS